MISTDTPPAELAALISQALEEAGITAVLSGGAAVQLYSEGRYVSKDLDFVAAAPHRDLAKVLQTLGFVKSGAGRFFQHPETDYLVEFPTWPPAVGGETIREWARIETDAGPLQILTATQCVQDRLAAYIHWHDPQSLKQAILVCSHQTVDLESIRQWAEKEGGLAAFAHLEAALG